MTTTSTPQLGDQAQDIVTGFRGTVIGRCEYLTGCEQVLLIPKVDKDGKRTDGEWFDADRCKVTKAGAVTLGPKVTPTTITRTRAGSDKPAPLR